MNADSEDFLVNSHFAAGRDLVAYADGTADPAAQRELESHLVRCDACSAAVEELRSTLLLIEIFKLDTD